LEKNLSFRDQAGSEDDEMNSFFLNRDNDLDTSLNFLKEIEIMNYYKILKIFLINKIKEILISMKIKFLEKKGIDEVQLKADFSNYLHCSI
jgi:hypothetical protein